MHRVALLSLLTLALACRESRSGAPESGTPDVAMRPGGAQVTDSEPGIEYEAPRLVPAIRAQIGQLREGGPASEENLTALRNGVGALVDAMQTDLNRVGVTDTGAFRALADSVLRTFGGGAGSPSDLSQEDARPATAQVERLIGLYEERMRQTAR
jgi:hypothetical protein